MVFLLLVSILFRRPLTSIILVGGIGGRGGIIWRQLKTISLQGPHFSPRSTVIKVQISGRMASVGISDVVSASVYSEKTRMKKLMMMTMMKMIIIVL